MTRHCDAPNQRADVKCEGVNSQTTNQIGRPSHGYRFANSETRLHRLQLIISAGIALGSVERVAEMVNSLYEQNLSGIGTRTGKVPPSKHFGLMEFLGYEEVLDRELLTRHLTVVCQTTEGTLR